MAASGDNHLGGQDFNLILLEHLVTTIAAKLSSSSGASVARMTLSIKDNGEAMRALREEVERVKIDLNDEADCSGAFVEGDNPTVAYRKASAIATVACLVHCCVRCPRADQGAATAVA